MADQPTVFADGIMEASVNFGVARITLAQTKADGSPAASGQLIVPVVQLPALANGMLSLMKQIEAKVKQAQAQQGAPPAAPQVNDAEPLPSAFRFSDG
jgi:hypothetical protein